MSAFNVLIAEVSCLNCGKQHTGRIQFKYGKAAFLQYHLGDTIKWGGNDIGNKEYKKVMVYGIAETDICPHCNGNIIIEDFDIFVENNVIVKVAAMENIECYLEEGNSEYVITER